MKCVQEVRLRNPESLRSNSIPNSSSPHGPNGQEFNNGVPASRVAGRREVREQQQQLQNQHFATAVRHKDKM